MIGKCFGRKKWMKHRVYPVVNENSDVIDPNSNYIYSLVPVFNEDLDMVKQNLDSLSAQILPPGTVNTIVMVFDGLNDRNKGLFEALNDLVVYDPEVVALSGEHEYLSWKNSDECKLVYRQGMYKGLRIVVSHKSSNKGKKDSLIVGEKLISDIFFAEHGKSNIFIYHTDGDTVADKNCLGELLKSMSDDVTLDGVSSLIRVYKRDGLSRKAWVFAVMQDFQYFYSLMVRRMAESAFSSTSCLPGCSNMIRVNEKSLAAINNYKNTPSNEEGLLQTVTRMQGTDRRYTTLLMREGAKLRMNWKAVVYTEPPLDIGSFIRQRRRWSSNSFFNSVVMLYSNVGIYVKISGFIDICRMFTTIFRIFSYVVFWFYLDKFSTLNIVLAVLFLALPYIYCLGWAICLVPNWIYIVVGFFCNKLFMPLLSVTSISKMFMTATNFDWGFSKATTQSLEFGLDTSSEDDEEYCHSRVQEEIEELEEIEV